MASDRRSCPHCNAAFAAPKGNGRAAKCPACGKPLSDPAARQWYYARNNQRVGPLSSAQLRKLAAEGVLSPSDMVLKAGSRKWVAAGEVKGLFPEAAATPVVPVAPLPSAAGPARATRDFVSRQDLLSEAQVVPDAVRCVQCGCCSYNCPIGIDVRAFAWRGRPIHDSHCLTCGECVKRCPRGVLAFERIPLFTVK